MDNPHRPVATVECPDSHSDSENRQRNPTWNPQEQENHRESRQKSQHAKDSAYARFLDSWQGIVHGLLNSTVWTASDSNPVQQSAF
jgi:hypothetical protein